MEMFLAIVVFMLGAIIGSFLNVIIIRLNTGESLVVGGSRCLSCNTRLSWRELVPIASYMAQKGVCRHCEARISMQYPIVEAFTGLVFVLAFLQNFSLFFTIYLMTVASLLIVIAVYDYYHHIIPNSLVYIFDALALAGLVWQKSPGANFLAGLVFFAFFGALWFVSKGTWMGLGDGKLALGIGWLLGALHGVLALLTAFWVGAFVGLVLLALSKKNYNLKSHIPFGPFLALGAFVALLYGSEIIIAIL